MSGTSNSIKFIFIFLTLSLSFSSAAYGQANDGGVQSKAGDPIREAIERRSREIALRRVVMEGIEKRDPREQQALVEQMNDDFKQIQIIRLGMVETIAAGKTFKYKQLFEDASEIKKRAARLRSSLALKPNSGSERDGLKNIEYDSDTIQRAASELCLEISRFTVNPLFKANAVYDPRNAAEADDNLQTIIEISTNLRISADKLRHYTKEH